MNVTIKNWKHTKNETNERTKGEKNDVATDWKASLKLNVSMLDEVYTRKVKDNFSEHVLVKCEHRTEKKEVNKEMKKNIKLQRVEI